VRVLVTGSDGYIGAVLVPWLAAAGLLLAAGWLTAAFHALVV